MNQDAMRAEINKACGWKQTAKGWWINPADTNGGDAECPDWLNDLNAMQLAVETLDEKQFAVFCRALGEIVEAFDWDRSDEDLRKVMEATALQRAEAFLRTISKTPAPNEKE